MNERIAVLQAELSKNQLKVSILIDEMRKLYEKVQSMPFKERFGLGEAIAALESYIASEIAQAEIIKAHLTAHRFDSFQAEIGTTTPAEA